MSEPNAIPSRLIGAIFVERGLVTDEQLQSALALQKEKKEHLGEILVQHFGVSRIELASVLAEQWAALEETSRTSPPPEEKSPPSLALVESGPVASSDDADAGDAEEERRPLGEIFVEQGLVTDEELDRALEVQKEGGEKLGEILVAQGSITRLQLASALADQWTALRKIRPPSSPEPVSPLPAVREGAPPEDVERLHEAVSALEQRLRAAESVATREPWREEIATTAEALQRTVSELEARVEAAARRDEPAEVEGLRATVDELAARVDELVSTERLHDADLIRRVETAAGAAEAAKSGLDGAFETLSLRLADVESRVHDRSEVAALQQEVEALETRVGELTSETRGSDMDELRDEVQRLLDEVTRRSESPRELDPELVARVDTLTGRIDEIAVAVQSREQGAVTKGERRKVEDALATLAGRVQALEGTGTEIQEIRQKVVELESREPVESVLADRLSHYGAGPDQVQELQERLDRIEQQSTELEQRNTELLERIEVLVGRLQTLETAGTSDELAALRRTVEDLSARPAGDPALAEQVERISRDLEGVASARPQLEELRDRIEQLAPATEVAALRRSVEELASRSAGDEELAARVEEIAMQLQDTAGRRLDELHGRLDVLASRPVNDPALAARVEEIAQQLPDPAVHQHLAELRGKLEELSSRPVSDPTLADRIQHVAERLDQAVGQEQLDELRGKLAELASRPAGDPALADRIEQIAHRLDQAVGNEQLDELGARLNELAGRVDAPVEGLAELRARVDELGLRPAGDPELAQRVERIANRVDDKASTNELEELRGRLEELSTRGVPPSEGLDDLRARIDELASRPMGDPDLAERVERIANRVDDKVSTHELHELRGLIEKLSARDVGPSEGMEELRARVDELAARPAGDPRLAEQVEELSRRFGAFDELRSRIKELEQRGAAVEELNRRLDELSSRPDTAQDEVVEQLSRRLDEVSRSTREVAELRERVEELMAQVASPDDVLVGLRTTVAELASRPAGDPELAERVERITRELNEAAATRPQVEELERRVGELAQAEGERYESTERRIGSIADDLRRAVERLGARVDSVEELAADKRHDDYELRIEKVESRLDETVARDATFADGIEFVTGRVAGLDDLRARLDELAGRFDKHESTQGKGVRKSELSALRTDLGERLEALEQRLETIAVEARKGQKSSVAKLEELVRSLQGEVGDRGEALGDRISAAESDTTALREQLERMHSVVQETDERRTSTQSELERRIEELGGRLAEELERPQTDLGPVVAEVRAELASLSARLDRSDETTAGALEDLKGDLEAVVRSSSDLLEHVERAGTGNADELRGRIDGIERRLEAGTAREEEQVRVVEEALREGLASLGRRLSETESNYIEAGGALRRSIERLGAAIVDADTHVAERRRGEPAPEVSPATGPFLAFVPNGTGYSLQEVSGTPPAVGEPIAISEDDDDFVVTRVGRSPLPLDRRRCVYLERRGAVASLDRVP